MNSDITVTYVDHMGTDLTVVNAARISMNKQSEELSEKDKRLIHYLAENKHMTPFEHNSLTVIIECPLYIRSQIHRHRTFSYNEVSRRYTKEDIKFYIPDVLRKQSTVNKQASDGEFYGIENDTYRQLIESVVWQANNTYNKLIEAGVVREQARMVLPQNLMTSFYMTGNLRNWVHFIGLRDSEHAQEEVRIVARQVKNILLEKFPVASRELLEVNE